MTPAMRISEAIDTATARGRTALVAFFTAGHPDKSSFGDTLAAVAEVADVVEIGVPFSDPMADGLTIQRASRSALEAGVSLSWILDQIGSMQPAPAAPLILMSYLNPLMAMGFETLAERSRAAGVAGFIVPDLPLEESAELDTALDKQGLALVQLVSPVTPVERLPLVCGASRGFLYAVTVTGTTGGDAGSASNIAQYLERVSEAAQVPVCAGFGVRSNEQFDEIGKHVPGVVVGSALVEALERGDDPRVYLEGLIGRTG
ncbi:MAG: tryptophan synthase subunit alpha [Gammaproteobacteria bacterium]